jgi:hypothetical protein
MTISADCKIMITDVSDASNYDECDKTFRIVKPDAVGGPYLFDKNTIALLHFDNNLNNRSTLSGNGVGNSQNIVSDPGLLSDLGNCLNTISPVAIPHSTSLNLTGDWTIEAWVKFTSFSNNLMYLLYKPGDSDPYQSNYSLEVNPSWGNVFFGYYFSALNSRIGTISLSPPLNEWIHVAFTRDIKNSKISVILHDKNRKLLNSASNTFTGTTTYLNAQDLIIGQGISGFIDEVRISNIVRDFTASTPEKGIKVTFKRPADWGASGVNLWAWTTSGNLFATWPGTSMTDAGNGWFSYTFDETVKNVNVIFSKNGTPQTIDILGVTQSTCYESGALQNGKITVTAVSCTTGNTSPELPSVEEQKITVYPQPAAGRFMVKLSDGSYGKEYAMSIIDLRGRIIRQSVFTGPAATLERGNLPSGLYILRLKSKDTGKQYSTKLSVE